MVLRAAVRLLMALPLPFAFAAGAFVGRLGWWLSPKLRRDVRANLAFAFPEKGARERDAIARESLVNLGKVAGELVTMRSWAPAIDAYARASPETLALVESAGARRKGVILVIGHIGNWELAARLSRYLQPNAVIAKRSLDRELDAMGEQSRAARGVGTIWRDDPGAARGMLRLFKQGGALGILIDQDTKVQSVFVPFFGRLAATPRAVGDLALRTGAAVLVFTGHRRGPRVGDGHEIEVVEVPVDAGAADREAEVVRITAACTELQEAAIRRHPAEWVWMHQRWKTRPAAERVEAAPAPAPGVAAAS